MSKKTNSFEEFDLLVNTTTKTRHPLFNYSPDWITDPPGMPPQKQATSEQAASVRGIWPLEPDLSIISARFEPEKNRIMTVVRNTSSSNMRIVGRGVNYSREGNINFERVDIVLTPGIDQQVEIPTFNSPYKFVFRTDRQTANGLARPETGWTN